MTEKTKELLEQLLLLSNTDKVEIIHALQKSLEIKVDSNIDEFWKSEVEARIDEYKAGKIKAYSIKEAFEMLEEDAV